MGNCMDVISNLSGYEITEQLYAGHRTLVYRGVRHQDQVSVVIKLLRNEFPSFNELVQFRNQYAIAKTLNSPNIITTYGLEPYNNSYALIMEDFGGVSLKEWAIKRGIELSLQDFLRIVISLSETLNTLHINKIIHKDLKPANILVNPDTKEVKLIDFSIASLLPRESIAIQNVNNLEGTLAYLSPEQTGRMNRGIDYRSDFYSFGITLYELLTKKLPFVANDLFGLLDLYQRKYPQPDDDIQNEIEAIDLDYIREDLPKLIASMREGVARIRGISNSLRTFSRADSDRPVGCNIHDGIDSTIMILKHRLKGDSNRPEIQVIKEYGDLPQVECFAGQLNQVFMNILANAIDAIEESNHGRSFADIKAKPNCITITTSVENNHVKIAIADNGNGMTEEVQQKVFDHLFTTKGVGKGTGLGLAIARQIVVEKHGGSLDVRSELNRGTEFCIRLPMGIIQSKFEEAETHDTRNL
jgi:signal transduction histidine kinase